MSSTVLAGVNSEYWLHEFFPSKVNSITAVFPCCLTMLPVAIRLFPPKLYKIPVQPAWPLSHMLDL